MPRQARRMSSTGYMHLIVRGNGRQALFEEEQDYIRYLETLERYCTETGVSVCSFCLMENHVHLLVHGEAEQTTLLMKKLGISYSEYFNRKYERAGHLFQDRFRSEPVEDEAYLLTVFRYILRNPEKAGICPAAEYPWSSYRAYGNPPAFMDLQAIYSLLGDREQYDAYIGSDNEDVCMEYIAPVRDDNWARSVLHEYLGTESGTSLQKLGRGERNEALRLLKEKGLSVKQIERVTGISRNIVQRATAGITKTGRNEPAGTVPHGPEKEETL